MAIEKKFIRNALNFLQVKLFLYKQLSNAGVSDISLQKTPIATRITVIVRKPGMVVGKRGSMIKDLCDILTKKFAVENPQFEILEANQPSLDAKLVAEKIGKKIEVRPNIKPIMRMAIREVMEAGAIGVEIRVAGKVVGKGGKAKILTARAGFLKKAGNLTKLVKVGHYVAYLKAGAIGIRVRIIPPGTVFPDQVRIPVRQVTEEEKKAEVEAAVQEPVLEEAQPVEAVVEEKPAETDTPKKTKGAKKKEKTEKTDVEQ